MGLQTASDHSSLDEDEYVLGERISFLSLLTIPAGHGHCMALSHCSHGVSKSITAKWMPFLRGCRLEAQQSHYLLRVM